MEWVELAVAERMVEPIAELVKSHMAELLRSRDERAELEAEVGKRGRKAKGRCPAL